MAAFYGAPAMELSDIHSNTVPALAPPSSYQLAAAHALSSESLRSFLYNHQKEEEAKKGRVCGCGVCFWVGAGCADGGSLCCRCDVIRKEIQAHYSIDVIYTCVICVIDVWVKSHTCV
eukprot:GHVQ01041447.1.p2 GENE.GHVQ01041447.1~~GHVQ01041447.1.p2  ORF type:complete len:118 (-),score=17.75 GHVQ01041447.1:240-593(-)